MRSFEIQRVDILIFFWRVLGVLNRTVGALAKPFGVFLHVGMIRRALKRDVQRDLYAKFFGLGDELFEIFQRTQVGMNRFVAPFVGADGPRAPYVIGIAR